MGMSTANAMGIWIQTIAKIKCNDRKHKTHQEDSQIKIGDAQWIGNLMEIQGENINVMAVAVPESQSSLGNDYIGF